MKLQSEKHAIDWVRKNILIGIAPNRKGKYPMMCPFKSVYAYERVTEELGKKIFKELEYNNALPDSIQEALNSGDGVYRP
jgi:hypothetical protein